MNNANITQHPYYNWGQYFGFDTLYHNIESWHCIVNNEHHSKTKQYESYMTYKFIGKTLIENLEMVKNTVQDYIEYTKQLLTTLNNIYNDEQFDENDAANIIYYSHINFIKNIHQYPFSQFNYYFNSTKIFDRDSVIVTFYADSKNNQNQYVCELVVFQKYCYEPFHGYFNIIYASCLEAHKTEFVNWFIYKIYDQNIYELKINSQSLSQNMPSTQID